MFDFGGETLMKWREPNSPVRKFLGILSFIVLLLIMIAFATKPNDQPVKDSHLPLLLIVFASLFITGFLITPTIRLKERCVTRLVGKYHNLSNYSEIECATVHHGNYKDKIFSIIKFKLKEKLALNTKVQQIVIPEDVNLDQVLQILRDKGVKIVEPTLPA